MVLLDRLCYRQGLFEDRSCPPVLLQSDPGLAKLFECPEGTACVCEQPTDRQALFEQRHRVRILPQGPHDDAEPIERVCLAESIAVLASQCERLFARRPGLLQIAELLAQSA